MDKHYAAFDQGSFRWQTFSASGPEHATPDASGYFAVSAPFDTLAEAEEMAHWFNNRMDRN